MSLRQRLSARQTQRLALTPAMRQGLSLLRLSTADLQDEIARQAAENPLLLVREPRIFRLSAPGATAARDVAQPESLTQSLHRQLAMMSLAPPVLQLAKFLTGDLTEDGYLDSPPEATAAALGLPVEQVEAAVAALQACEPAGVAARDLADCLALQLIDRGVPETTARAACACLDLLVAERWPLAERRTGLPRAELQRIARQIRTLSPRPAAAFAEPANPLIPEIAVESDALGRISVTLNRDAAPRVGIDHTLARQMQQGAGAQDGFRRQALALIAALRFRGSTLLRVARALTEHNRAFFTDAGGGIAPLTRAALAAELGLHPTTVGRAVAHKALIFGGTVYPLSHFLSPALQLAEGGSISAHDVQRRIRRMVEAESPGAALSDAAIAEVLRGAGVDIARRTVAKYRECMDIPTSFERNRRSARRSSRPAATPSGHVS